MTKLCLVLLALSGCAVDDLEAEEFAVTDDGTLLLGAWGTPARLAISSDFVESQPTISADGLTLFYTVTDFNGATRLYTSTRAARDAAWATPAQAPSALSYAREPDLSDDAHTMWFAYQWPISSWDIAVSTKECNSAPWTSPAAVTELQVSASDGSPFVSSDGRWMYFTRRFTNGTTVTSEIYVTSRATKTSPWDEPRLFGRFNSDGLDDNVTMSGDRLEAYFDSDRDGIVTMYRSTRAVGEPWSTPQIVAELLTGSQADMTPDGHVMVLVKGGDLYETSRP